MRTIITKEIEVTTCDICGKESDIITKCRVCGKDICNDCRIGDQCIGCWKDNCSYANIKSTLTEERGYESRPFTTIKIEHENKAKWNDLIHRFVGKRIKITIEESPKYEEPIEITDFDLNQSGVIYDSCNTTNNPGLKIEDVLNINKGFMGFY